MNKLPTFFRARTTGARERMGCTVLMQQTLTPRHMEAIIGTGRRRRWSAEMNAHIAGESFEPGVGVSEVVRRDVAAEIGEVLSDDPPSTNFLIADCASRLRVNTKWQTLV
jgi:Transposase